MLKRTIVLSLFTLLSHSVFAEDVLSGEEIRALISGKTVMATTANRTKNIDLKQYYAADGTAISASSTKSLNGVWRINDQGLHCTQWEGKEETCAKIVKAGDGYQRIEGDTLRGNWHRIVDGNAI
jgi:hypothetical protein